jgi:Ribbon-helix-helix domain
MVPYGRAKVLAHQVRSPGTALVSARESLTGHVSSCIVTAMARKKVSTTIYITPEQSELLKLLHGKTKVPVAEYIRQGIDLLLEKERHNMPGQLTLQVPHGGR